MDLSTKLKYNYLKKLFLGSLVVMLVSILPMVGYSQCPPTITAVPRPGTPIVTSGTTVKFCAGDTLALVASPSSGVSYTWYKNSVVIPDSTRNTLNVANNGDYHVVVSGCGSSSNVINIIVNPLPTAYITCDPTPPVCSGTPLTFTLNTNASEFYWLPPVPPTAMYTNPISLLLSGSALIKAVTINNSNPQCSKVANYWAQVDFPIYGGLIAANDTICSGETPAPITNIALPTGGNGTYTYTWLMSTISDVGPFSLIPGENGLDYTPGALTQTTWFARAAQSPPCSEGLSNPVMVLVNQHPTVTSATTDTICSGQSINYTPTSGVANSTFAWTATVTSGSVSGVVAAGTGSIVATLSMPAGTALPGKVTYTITPTGPAPTFCPGTPKDFVVTVMPEPLVTNVDLQDTICAGGTSQAVVLSSSVTGTTFSWYANVPWGISMNPYYGMGNIPAITIYSVLTDITDIPITITPTGPDPSNCGGSAVTYTITVKPSPTVTNSPLSQSICSENSSVAVTLTSNVVGTNFTWTAIANPATLTGFQASGGNTIPAQTITNPENAAGYVTYTILPSGSLGACPAAPRDYVINVDPKPVITSSLTEALCSMEQFNYSITSNVTNCSFYWSRAAVAGISNLAANGTNPLISETLINTTNSDIVVTYVLTPTGPAPLSCLGVSSSLQVTVHPLPTVDAGSDKNISYGTNTMITGTASGGQSPLSYVWSPLDKISSLPTNPSIQTVNLFSNTEFTLTVTDGLGCQKSDNMWVYLTGSAVAANPTAVPNPVCYGSSVNLNANASGGSGTYSYSWSPTTYLNNPLAATPIATPPSTITYQVTVNDGFNSVTSSVTVDVTQLPQAYNVSGGGAYCAGGSGVSINLSNSEPGVAYWLELEGVQVGGSSTFGTGSPLVWPSITQAGSYTVNSERSGCQKAMTGLAMVSVNPIPTAFTLTGGGTYPSGGSGVMIGLSGSELGVEYDLVLQGTGVVTASPVIGTGSAISFGLQSPAGTYTALAYNPITQCSANMSGSVGVSINPSPTVFNMTGGGAFCAGSTGVAVGLDGSEFGIDYYLYRDGIALGTMVPGTGFPLSFGLQTVTGNYSCKGFNPVSSIQTSMIGVAGVTSNPLPGVYSLFPTGQQCPGVELKMNGGQAGVMYELLRNGLVVDTVYGTGTLGVLSFGEQQIAGTYTARATILATGCQREMNGSSIITSVPNLFNVIPAGILCEGDNVYLDESELGVVYQLRRNDTVNVGTPMAGTGSLLDFGPQYYPGVYKVLGINQTTLCSVFMNDSSVLYDIPLVYTLMPNGDTCGPADVWLNGSQLGYTYYLYLNGVYPPIASAVGTGGVLSFGSQVLSGVYTAKALDGNLLCTADMAGSLLMNVRPTIYNVVPNGPVCSGTIVSIDNSQLGVIYQLLRDDTIAVGTPMNGTGTALSFGAQTLPGTYTVIAQFPSTSCSEYMSGSAVLGTLPIPYSITPSGTHCSGTSIGLNGSQTGLLYRLIRNGFTTTIVATLPGTGSPLDFGPQYVEGNYTITAYSALGCTMDMVGTVTIVPRPEAYTITPAGTNCEIATIGLSGSQIGVNYELYLNGFPLAVPLIVQGTGGAISFGQQTSGVYTIWATVVTTGCQKEMQGSVTISPKPTVSAGDDDSICASSTFTLNATASNYSTLLWTSSGDGSFTPSNSLSAVYTPGNNDKLGGSIFLILKATGNTFCPGMVVRDTLVLTITALPTVEAGPNAMACEDIGFQLVSSASNYSSVLWNSTGDGSFSSQAIITPIYYAGANDLTTGTATLSVQAFGQGECSSEIAQDQLVLTFLELPIANAGADGVVCANGIYQLMGTGTDWTTALWSSSGDGQFGNASNISTTYTPGNADRANGSVVLTLSLAGSGACSSETHEDQMILTINPLPVPNAGPDAAICAGSTYSLNGQATNSGIIRWKTAGDGTFSNSSILNPIYTPGALDTVTGLVQLSLVAHGLLGCANDSVADFMMLTLEHAPQAYAGADQLLCSNAIVNLAGNAVHGTTVLWETTGDGQFSAASSLQTQYMPGTNDLATGMVSLVLKVNGGQVCATAIDRDTLEVVFSPLPTINVGADATICAGNTLQLNAIATNVSSYSWTSSGTGGFSSTFVSNPIYMPSVQDIASGLVVLRCTVAGQGGCNLLQVYDELTLYIDNLPEVDAVGNLSICAGTSAQLTATASHYGGLLWSTSGDGTFGTPTALTTTYNPGQNDIGLGSVVITLTASGQGQCSSAVATDQLTLTVNPLPQVNAGPNDSVCAAYSFTTQGTTTNCQSVLWTTSGDGSFTDATSLMTNYLPGLTDKLTGVVALTLTGYGALECASTSVNDVMVLYVMPMPTVSAGADGNICASASYTTNGLAGNYSQIRWRTSGDGSFSNRNILDAIYYPGNFDKSSGQVTLTLVATGVNACSNDSVQDATSLTISPLPIVNAGPDETICSGDDYQLAGTGSNYSALMWSTSGTGTFSSYVTLTPVYYPSQADYATGFVELSILASGSLACSSASVTDTMRLFFNPLPTVNAGADAAICAGNSHICNGIASGYSSLRWRTDGSGAFSNTGIPSPVYTPSAADTAVGIVHLSLTAKGLLTCVGDSVVDVMTLTINPRPVAIAGADQLVCENSCAQLTGNAWNESSVIWSTTGDGQYSAVQSLATQYCPGINDKSNGGVWLKLSAYGSGSCAGLAHADSLYLSLGPLPQVNAGLNDTICHGQNFQANATTVAVSSLLWTTSGDGSFDNGLINNPVYTPGTADMLNGFAYLTVTAQGTTPCGVETAQDQLKLTILPLPTVNAGVDITACASAASISVVATAQHYSVAQWTTSGTGSFVPSSGLSVNYLPTTADIAGGSVTLSCTVHGLGSCTLSTASDALLLTFQPMPVANAGNDAAICSGATHQLQGTAVNALSIDWLSMGDGTFNAPGIANPIYTPGSSDKTAGTVSLVFKAFGISPCNLEQATDTMVLSIRPLPTASLGGTAVICEGSPTALSVNLTGTPPWSITYSSGAQNFVINNILASPYTFNVSPTITTAYTLQAISDQFCSGVSFGGTALVTVNPLPLPFLLSATGNGQYCQGSAGVELVLGGSEQGIVYQLMYGSQALGVPRAGTGNAISFGYVSNPGVYHVVASNPLTNCSLQMPGNVTVSIIPLPIVDFVSDTACLGSPTTFTLTGASVQNLVSCAWLFGDGGSATYAGPANAVHTYAAYGNYNASVTVTDVNGCQRTIGHPVSVYPSPVSFFAWDEPVCDGSAVDFVNLSYTSLPDYIAQWTWYFGDGSSSLTIPWPGNPNVGHSFPTSGLFPVSLKVESEFGCTDSTMRMLNVLPQPVVDFSYDVACEAMAVQFQDLTQVGAGGEATEWFWDFGDPTTGTANQAFVQHPSHTFSSYGSFVVTLHVVTSNACENQVSKTVVVNPGPQANFVSDTVCAGEPTQFTDLSQGGNGTLIVEWDWDFGDGSSHSNQANPMHLFAAPGLYAVKLTVTDANGCEADTTLQVRVWELPYASFTSSAQNCAGSPVQFTSQSASSQGLLVLYEWSFGDGGTATVASPAPPNVQHTYTLPGQYLVTLVVTNSNNCQSTATAMVTIGANPVANFSFPTTGACEGTALPFTDASVPNGSGSITSWLWNFGDPLSGGNNTSSQQNPSHVFANAGAYDVVLTVNSINTCQGTVTKQVMISAKPQADFTADTACLGEPTTFVNLSTPNGGSLNTYDWDFGDGSPHSNNAAPQHLYAAAGTYYVKLTVGNTNGCSHDTTIAVMVAQLPLAVFTYPNQACAQTLVSFDDLSSTPQGYIVQWQWSFGDGATEVVDFPNPPDVQHAYASAGSYNVELTVVSSLGCEKSVTHTVVITSPPMANFNTGPTSCAGMPIQFNDATQTNGGGPLVTWSWDFGDPSSGTSNTSGMQNPIHVFDTAGTYNVKLIVSNTGGCNDTIIKPVTVGEAPLANFAADTVCLGQPTHFADSSIANAASIASWLWLFGDGASSTQQNPQHTYANWGSYNVTLQVTNSAGCMRDTTIEVLVRPLPVALFASEGQCAGASTQFTDLSTTVMGSITTWNWDFGDGGTDTVQNPAHTYAAGGTYLVSLTVGNEYGCEQTLVQSISIFNSPTAAYNAYPVFCPAGQVTFQDLSVGNGSPITQRMWYFGDGFYSSAANPVYTYAHPDSCYMVTLITSNAYACADTLVDTVCVKPAFAFTFGYDAGCAGLATSFSPQNLAQGDTLMFVQWNFGDPASGPYNQSNAYGPSHVYANPGTYFVKLRAWNSDNCVDSTYQEVVVRQVPEAEFTWPIAPACDTIVSFTNATNAFGAAIDSVYWNFGDGSDTLVQAPLPPFMQHKFPQYGTYGVMMKAYIDNGCSAEVQHQVKVKCLSSYFAVADTVCQGALLAFADSSAPAAAITSWLWLFGDGDYSQYFTYKPQATHVYDTTGLLQVSLTTTAIVNGLSVQDVYTQYIYVRPAPKAGIAVEAACQGQEVQFRDVSTQYNDSITAWKWYFGDGKTSLLQDPAHLYKTDTAFEVVLEVVTEAGCFATDTFDIALAPVPALMLSPASGLYCNGGTVALADTSGVAFTNYRWIWGDGDTLDVPEPAATHVYELGSYWARLAATSSYGCVSVDSAWLEVKPGPVAAFAIDKPKVPVTDPVVYLSDKTNSPISPLVAWNWYVNDTVFAGNGQSILYSFADTARYAYVPDTGMYKVTLWAQNAAGCADTVSRYVTLYAEEAFFSPTAFSPNGDGKNDYFIPLVKYYKPEGFLFQVYNRWGMLVFESPRADLPWDGYFRDGPAPVGVYTWLIEAIDLDNKRVTKQGSVLLIR